MDRRRELLHALIDTLPEPPSRWMEADRQRFLAAVRACLSWCYPTAEELRAEGIVAQAEEREERCREGALEV